MTPVSIPVPVSASFLILTAGPHLLQVSVPRNPYPDKTAISSDFVVSIFHTKLNQHETGVKIVHGRDSLTPQLVVCEACGSSVVIGARGEGRKKAGSYLWKAGCNNSALAQETVGFTPDCRLSGVR